MLARCRLRRTAELAESPRIIGRMLLALDVGNTNITVGRFKGTDLLDTRRVATKLGSTVVGLASALDLDGVSDIVLASVVPAVSATVQEICIRQGISLLVAEAGNIPM